MPHQAQDVKLSDLIDSPIQTIHASDLEHYAKRFLAIVEPLKQDQIMHYKPKISEYIEVLLQLSALVQELKTFIFKVYPPSSSIGQTSQSIYQLLVNLSFLNEQIPLLLQWFNETSLLASAPTQPVSAKNRAKICQFQQIIKISRQIPMTLCTLRNQCRLDRKGCSYLRLVPSVS